MKPRDKNAKIRVPKFYKRLLLVAIVVGPMWWLVFTEDGQRRSDMALLYLFGDESLYLNLKVLDDRFTEQEMRQLYPDIPWQCENQASAFGVRTCSGKIGSFNQVPADHAKLYFGDSTLNAVKVVYSQSYHGLLGKDLNHQLGKPLPPFAADDIPTDDTVVRWRTDGGFVMAKKKLNKGDQPALLWLSSTQMARGSRPPASNTEPKE
jgi:hypothetical protein